MQDAKDEANRVIRELNGLGSKDLKKANELRNKLNADLKETESSQGLDLSVLLRLNNQETNKPSGQKLGNAKNSAKSNTHTKSSVHISNTSAYNGSPEINLIGENVDTAVMALDKYLDNCTMAHLKQVRVIHGKGTGKLREGIHNYLKKSKYVSSYRIAGYGEGDYGVTIVELK